MAVTSFFVLIRYDAWTQNRTFGLIASDAEEAAHHAWTLAKHYNETLINVKMNRKRYFPNRWTQIKNAPEEAFESITYEDFIDLAVFELISPSHTIMLRVEWLLKDKIKEFAYKREHAANEKLLKLLEDKEPMMITIVTGEGMVLLGNFAAKSFDSLFD